MDTQDNKEKIQEFLKNPFVIIGMIIQIIFIILVFLLIQNITKKETIVPDIKINYTFDNMPKELPESIKSDFESAIYNISSLNQGDIVNINDSGAVVRDESINFHFFNKLDIYYLSFIIDIPTIQQSYRLVYQWSNNKNNKYVPANEPLISMCLPKSKMIYSDFNCKDKYGKNSPSIAIHTLIKNLNWKVNGQLFTITPSGKTSDSDFYYNIEINSCGDKDLENQTKQVFEKQIQDLGFELSEIPYQINGYCNK